MAKDYNVWFKVLTSVVLHKDETLINLWWNAFFFWGTYRHSVEFETLQLRPVGNCCAVVPWEEELKDKNKRTTTDENGTIRNNTFIYEILGIEKERQKKCDKVTVKLKWNSQSWGWP